MTSEFGHGSFEFYIFEAFLVIDYLVGKCKILCPAELAWIFHSMPLLSSGYLPSDFLILKTLVRLCLDGFLHSWPLSQDPQLCLELLEFHFSVAAQMIFSVSLLSYFFVNCPKPAFMSNSIGSSEGQTPCRYWMWAPSCDLNSNHLEPGFDSLCQRISRYGYLCRLWEFGWSAIDHNMTILPQSWSAESYCGDWNYSHSLWWGSHHLCLPLSRPVPLWSERIPQILAWHRKSRSLTSWPWLLHWALALAHQTQYCSFCADPEYTVWPHHR